MATVCFSGMLEDKLRAVASAGFDGVEIFENDLVVSAMSPESVRSMCADLGLTVDLYQPFRDFEALPQELHDAALRRADRKFDLMERLGAGMLLVCSTLSPHASDDDGLAAQQLRALAERASARGIRIAYEALAWGRFVNSWEHSWQIVRRADHPALGLCLDSFHVLSRDPAPMGLDTVDSDKLFFLQLADAPRLDMDVLQWSRHHRLFPGQGSFGLPEFLGQVLASGYGGPLSLEVFNDVFRQTDPGPAALDAMRSLISLEEAVHEHEHEHERVQSSGEFGGGDGRRRYGREHADGQSGQERGPDQEQGQGPGHGQSDGHGPSPSGVGRRIRPAAPPPAPELLGHAFVELAVDDGSAAEITAALAGLGFVRTGLHRSKPVELWRQGGCDVVLNRDGHALPAEDEAHAAADSPAREPGEEPHVGGVAASEGERPPSAACDQDRAGDAGAVRTAWPAEPGSAEILALAVESRDPAQSARRAEALLATPLPRRRGPGEAELTAVAAPDGTRLFFCPGGEASGPDWRADFVPTGGGDPVTGAGAGTDADADADADVDAGAGGGPRTGAGAGAGARAGDGVAPGVSGPASPSAPEATGTRFSAQSSARSSARSSCMSRSSPGDLLRIDHVALAQPNDQFTGSMTFYQSVLDLRERDFAEYAAPFGLVRSRTVTNASGSVRIAMHGALLRRGGWAPSVPDPEHISFTTRDVFAAARLARARGLEILPVTGNYYDDLDARYAPDPQLLGDMRELNILYDRDEHGEFFHFCTGLLGSRVFFEVVQRTGGYRGHGAVNAPVRMAAHRQARAARRQIRD